MWGGWGHIGSRFFPGVGDTVPGFRSTVSDSVGETIADFRQGGGIRYQI